MIKKIDIRKEAIAQEVLKIQHEAYLIEAQWIGTRKLPPLKETLEELRNCQEAFLAYYLDEKIVGVLAYEEEGQVTHLCRLFVLPSYSQRGIGEALFAQFETQGHGKIKVMTGTKNQPAVNFYLKHGFREIEKKILSPNLSLTFFEK